MATDFGGGDLGQLFNEKHAEAVSDLGRLNLAIFGKTGAGKSTLINGVFGRHVSATGTGAPVTAAFDYYEHPNGILGIYDSQGFETGHAGDEVLFGLERFVAQARSESIERQLHVAWYVVHWSDRRFEAAQEAFVRRLAGLLPVVMVMSQVPMRQDGTVHHDAITLAEYIKSRQLPLSPGNVIIPTNALADPFLETVVFGLDQLLNATFSVVPEATRKALVAAQMVDKERKRRASTAIVQKASASALATGATPIPFSDAAILVPLQVSMIARISATYGLTLPANRLASIVGSVLLAGGATTAGRWLVTSALKFAPGGQLPAAAISGAVAGTITRSVGMAWIAACEYLVARQESGQEIDVDMLIALFKAEFDRRGRSGR